MPDAKPDVMKVLSDLEYKAVGVDPATKKMPEGFFVSFRPIGLPIPEDDYKNPWTPTGGNLKEILSSTPKADAPPASVTNDAGEVTPVSASSQLDPDQWLSAGIGASMQAYLNTFMLTDDKLVMSNEYRVMPSSGKVNDAWYAIINGANGIPSNMELNDTMKQAIEDAKAVLMTTGDAPQPTPKYEAYMKYKEAYTIKIQERNQQYASVLSDPMALQAWPIQGKVIQDGVDEAWKQWQGFGFKAEIEKAEATLAAQGIDPAILLIARAKIKYENSLINIPNVGNIPYTLMSPNKWYSATGGGWNKYTKTSFHSESHVSKSSSSTNAKGAFSLGFFSAGGSGKSKTDKTNLDVAVNDLNIEFEYTVVDIKRPWLDTTLLNMSNWFLAGDYPAGCISKGTYGQELEVNGKNEMLFLPSVVTSLILVRNLKIKFAEAKKHRDTLEKSTSGGGVLGIGPFYIGGSHSQSQTASNSILDINTEGINSDGVQLVGYVSTIMPSSPKLASAAFMQKKKEERVPQPAPQPAPQPSPAPAPQPAPEPANL